MTYQWKWCLKNAVGPERILNAGGGHPVLATKTTFQYWGPFEIQVFEVHSLKT